MQSRITCALQYPAMEVAGRDPPRLDSTTVNCPIHVTVINANVNRAWAWQTYYIAALSGTTLQVFLLQAQ
jgi:hypothetical protein